MMRSLLVVAVLSLSCWSQQVTDELRQKISDQVKIAIPFHTPEPEFHRLQIERKNADANGIVTLRLTVPGLSPSEKYVIMNWEVGASSPQTLVEEVSVDEKGLIYCGDKLKNCESESPGGRMVLRVKGELGQPVHLILAKKDKTPLALGEEFAKPATASENGCRVDAIWVFPYG